METIENNKLIAEFMGSKYINEPFKDSKGEMQDFWHWSKPDNGYPRDMNIDTAQEMSTAYMIENFSYHKSWDWLIPVIQSIYTLEKYYDYVQENSSMMSDGQIKVNPFSIEKTHYNVIEFIKWYNANK